MKRFDIKKITAKCGRKIVAMHMKLCYRPQFVYLSGKKIESDKPTIIISNHIGHNDGQMSYVMFDNSSLLIAKDWFEKPIVKWITYQGDFIPIDRYGLDTDWLRMSIKAINSGKNVIIFPEGHTSKNKQLDEFKPGFVMLAISTGAKIMPVYIDGEYNHFLGKRLRIYVNEPIEISNEGKGMNSEYLKKESERFKNIIEQMKEGLENG